MKDSRFIPPNFINLMSVEERKRFGVHTNAEHQASNELKLEREDHNLFCGWLHLKGFDYFYHSDPVRRSTIAAGLPDFGVFRDSRIIFIEFKLSSGRLSEGQEKAFQIMGSDGNMIFVCYSFDEARRAVSKFFNLL